MAGQMIRFYYRLMSGEERDQSGYRVEGNWLDKQKNRLTCGLKLCGD